MRAPLRRVEVLAHGNWFEHEEGIEGLLEGVVFRMFEAKTSKPVAWKEKDNATVFVATGLPYLTRNEKGEQTWAIHVDPFY